MARKLASIVEIGELQPIEGADKIEVAIPKGKGWKVVVGKGDFHVGDIAVMFEIDSFLDTNDERYAFLRDRCLRKFVSKSGNVLREGLKIKTIKLRGVISQGLLMPLDKFPEIKSRIVKTDEGVPCLDLSDFIDENNQEIEETTGPGLVEGIGKAVTANLHIVTLLGADVTKVLHVEHYDEVKEQLQPETGSPISADAKGNFPTDYCPKTDEIRLQACTDYFETQKGKLFEVTEKRDGSSISFGYCPLIDA